MAESRRPVVVDMINNGELKYHEKLVEYHRRRAGEVRDILVFVSLSTVYHRFCEGYHQTAVDQIRNSHRSVV